MDLILADLKCEPIPLGEGPRAAEGDEPSVAGAPTKTGTLVYSPPTMVLYGNQGWPAFEVSSVTSMVSLVQKGPVLRTQIWAIFVIKAYATPDANGVGFVTYIFDATGKAIATSASQMLFPCGPSSVMTVPVNLQGRGVYAAADNFTWGISNGRMTYVCPQ